MDSVRLHALLDAVAPQSVPLLEEILTALGSWPPQSGTWHHAVRGVTIIDPPNRIWEIRDKHVMLDVDVAQAGGLKLEDLNRACGSANRVEVLWLTAEEIEQVNVLRRRYRVDGAGTGVRVALPLSEVLKLLAPEVIPSDRRPANLHEWQSVLKHIDAEDRPIKTLEIHRWTLYRPGEVYDQPILSLFPGSSYDAFAQLPTSSREISVSIAVR